MPYTIEPIAHVTAARVVPVDDRWGDSLATITLADAIDDSALTGLDAFSHVEVLFVFDRVPADRIVSGARHPRDNQAWPKVGIFAQRGKNRPNRLGSTICRVVRVEGRTLTVRELDAIDGTPVVDIKPVLREFLPREATAQPSWATELMAQYWAPPMRDDDSSSNAKDTPPLAFRTATAADLPAIVHLLADDALGATRERDVHPLPDEYARAFTAMQAQGGNDLLLAIADGAIVGCLQLTIVPGLSRFGAIRGQIEGVRVASTHRGQRIGEAMIRHAIDRCRAAGCSLLQLTSDVTRVDARRFYERLGFEATHVGMKRKIG